MNAFAFYCESITDVKVTLHLAKIKLLFLRSSWVCTRKTLLISLLVGFFFDLTYATIDICSSSCMWSLWQLQAGFVVKHSKQDPRICGKWHNPMSPLTELQDIDRTITNTTSQKHGWKHSTQLSLCKVQKGLRQCFSFHPFNVTGGLRLWCSRSTTPLDQKLS